MEAEVVKEKPQTLRDKVVELLTGTSNGDWTWRYQDASMVCLTGPSEQEDFVMEVTACNSCSEGKKGWEWGRCATPTLENAKLIAAAPMLARELLAALDEIDRLKGVSDGYSGPYFLRSLLAEALGEQKAEAVLNELRETGGDH